MALSNGIITAPVTDSDLKTLFGAGNNINDWCNNGAINKFARYKPVRLSKKELLTNADRQSVAHGITIPDVVTSSSITGAAIMDAAANDWEYNLPTGGDNQKYREADFCNCEHPSSYGYYHNAVPPIQVNYPQNGWKYTRGSASRYFSIYVDLDPDDSAINLQAEDFVASGLNLNEWTLIAYVDSQYFSTKLFASDDTILSGGEISGSTIVITIPSGSSSYSADVYICMYRFNSGRYEFLPLPKQGSYNPTIMSLYIKDDASESGGGIEGDVFQNTQASYALDGEFRPLADFTDGGEAKWAMRTDTGNLVLKVKLTNKSGTTSTIQRNAFNIAIDEAGGNPQFMYDNQKRVISSVSIANNATVTIYLEWDALFTQLDYWNSSTKNSNWSFDLTRSGAYLVGSDMYAFKGSYGWVARSS
jgi:hypothetical protein